MSCFYTIEYNNEKNMYLSYFDELVIDPLRAYRFKTEEEAKEFIKLHGIPESNFHVQKMPKGEKK